MSFLKLPGRLINTRQIVQVVDNSTFYSIWMTPTGRTGGWLLGSGIFESEQLVIRTNDQTEYKAVKEWVEGLPNSVSKIS